MTSAPCEVVTYDRENRGQKIGGDVTRQSKSRSIGYAIQVNGRDAGISFPTVEEAERSARHLLARGFEKVDIADRVSGRVVVHVSPSPTDA